VTSTPIKLAIFDVELEDFSAGASSAGETRSDTEQLARVTHEVREIFARSGRYRLVVADSADGAAAKAHTLRDCEGCDAAIALKLGAQQSFRPLSRALCRQSRAAIPSQPAPRRSAAHLERARAAIDRIGGDPEAFVRSHVRRLEALRRAGHVERIDFNHWRVPPDLPERGQAYDLARDGGNIRASILSPTDLSSQIGHDGATWLDRELVSRQRTALADEGFGLELKAALDRRKLALVDMGHATDLGGGHVLAPSCSSVD
jgi:hypothetical protein